MNTVIGDMSISDSTFAMYDLDNSPNNESILDLTPSLDMGGLFMQAQ